LGLLALCSLALLGFGRVAAARPVPLLGPQGPQHFGPLEPGEAGVLDRGVVLVDPRDGTLWVEVWDLVIDGAPQALSLARCWEGGAWHWLGNRSLAPEGEFWRVERPGEEALQLQLDETLEDLGWSHPDGHVLRGVETGFELEHADGSADSFDQDGQLQARRDPDGRSWHWTWEGSTLAELSHESLGALSFSETSTGGGALRVARGPAAVEASYEYSEGLLQKVVAANGLRHRYLYDEQGRLRVLMWGDGSRVVVYRDEVGRVTGLDGPGASRWRFGWGERGLERAQDGGGGSWQIKWGEEEIVVTDPSQRSVRTRLEGGKPAGWNDPAGNTTRLLRDQAGRLRAVVGAAGGDWRLEMDARGDLAGLVDPSGGSWSYVRDSRGHLLRIVDPLGRTQSYRRDASGAVREYARGDERLSFSRDQAGLVREIRYANGATTRIERDAAGRVTALLDDSGRKTSFQDHVGRLPASVLGAGGARWQLLFDRLGRVRGLEAPGGSALSWSRDQAGNLTELRRAAGSCQLGRRVDGRVTQVRDALGRVTGWGYDAAGRLTSWRRPDGSRLSLLRDAVGEVTDILFGEASLRLLRDLQGRPLRAMLRAEDSGQLSELVAWEWDAAGRLARSAWRQGALVLRRDLAGRCAAVVLGEREYLLQRDGAGRLAAVASGDERWTVLRDADGLVTGLTASTGGWQLRRDVRGLPEKLGLGQQQEDQGRDLRFQHGVAGELLRVKGPGDASLGIRRDVAGRVLSLRLSGGPMVWVQHDRQGTRLRYEDSGGAVLEEVALERDALERLALRRDDTRERRYRYGPFDNLLTVEEEEGAWSHLPGRLEAPGGVPLASLDPQGRPLAAFALPGQVAWGLGQALSYALDEDGRVIQVEGEAGVILLEHDALGRLCTVDLLRRTDRGRGAEDEAAPQGDEPPGTTSSFQLDYDPFGNLVSVVGPGGSTQLVSALGSIVGLEQGERRAAVLQGPLGTRLLAAAGGWKAYAPDESGGPAWVFAAQGQPSRVRSSPGGLADGDLQGPFGAWGRFSLFAGGPLVGPQDALDPLTGLPTAPPVVRYPWSAEAWPLPEGAVEWPRIDGDSSVSWDPAGWAPEGVWHDPLALLVALGELKAPSRDRWWRSAPTAAPLPWLPGSLTAGEPPFGPGPQDWPLELDAVSAAFLPLAIRPMRAPADLGQAILARDMASLPRALPDLPLPNGLGSTR